MARAALLAVFICLAAHGAAADCLDAYWDCLLVPEGGLVVPSGGGVLYGNCWSWRRRSCAPCNPRDAEDAEWILAKCNADVLECRTAEGCTIFADLEACCNGNGRCGNLGPKESDGWQSACGKAGWVMGAGRMGRNRPGVVES
ncbi:hypothetical protein HYH03_014364 [Edaphochlamys debaryana]|uniref:Uncharacterized protein n=1 Tax=Edaphochlamys debaryana TaxID=47281 RepID=A0A835XLF9_9CHLO|nr:hypothetical protein HYH03_014364 [Edaphochlamys debaryana]|eukprot:KAG2486992.1 hypothetical protein HYH03_014364 [Edaphochlamys debaryana]